MPITYLDEEPQVERRITYLDEEKPKTGISKVAEDVTNYVFPQFLTDAKFKPGQRNLLGDLGERPGAAIRSWLMGKGYKKGALNPEEAPNLSEEAIKEYIDRGGKNPVMGTLVGMGGEVLNQITEPANLLALFLPKAPGAKQAGQEIGRSAGLMKNLVNETTGKIISSPVGKMTRQGLTNIESGITAPIRFVQNITRNIKNVKDPVQFSKTVRKTFFDVKRKVGDEFEKGITTLSKANPEKRIDLSAEVQYLKDAIDDTVNNPGLGSQVKSTIRSIRNPEKAKVIQGMIENPMNAKDLTLAQAQEIKNMIQQAPAIATKLKQGKFADWKPGDLELLDLIDDIKLAQSEVFPEMAQVRKPYAEFMNNYKNVKNMFKPGALLNKMRSGFGDEEIQSMVKAILPQDTLKAIRGFRRTGKALKIGAGITGLLTAEELIRRGIRSAGR